MHPTPLIVRIALGLLVADGLAGLYLGELLGPVGLAAAGAGVVASYGAGWLNAWLGRARGLGRLVAPVAAVASGLDLAVLAPTVLDALARLVCFLVIYKLFTLRTVRDSRTIGFLTFFMLVAASSSAFGVGYLFVFLVFVGLATWLAVVQQVLVESAPALDRTVVGPAVRWQGLTVVAGGAALAALVVTAVLFFAIPRVGLGALPFRARTGPMLTGFSDRVELGAYGEIETDDTVVMRVTLPDWVTEPDRLPGLRWRGVALDTYRKGAWTVARPARVALPRSEANEFPVGIPRGSGRILVQEIYLEPLGSDVIFATPRVLHLRVRGTVQMDGMGGFMVPSPLARLSYTVYSELDERAPRSRVRPAPPLDDAARARYLQLPPLTPRVEALAREVAGDSSDPLETARRLTTFLSREFRYTLSLERVTAVDPVEEFLFVRRAGNCEYFAAALAVMLRSLDIPARVVNGFQRGEWNPYGRYYMVRLRDAHSWVEAWTGPAGWVTLDPSPRIAAPTTDVFASVRLYLDSLRLRWHRYVINWTLRDQIEVAWAIRRQATSWQWRRLDEAFDELPGARLVLPATILLGAVVVGVALYRRRSAGARPAPTAVPGFYARALRRLGRRGLAPAAAETAREFAERVASQAPGCALPFATVTAAYERCRFAGLPLASRDAADVDAALAALDRAPSAPIAAN